MERSKHDVAPCGLTYEMIMLLQTRDISPEDYDLLLQLDESVPNKTVDASKVDSLDTFKFSSTEHDCDTPCSVCLSPYCDGESITKLSCDHIFHKDCIDNYLKNYGRNCPLCGLDVTQT
mmetsp:Transcript_23157/g.25715  ORF Transcript_23157/g.25715 Transcript_23157/m.25715 type:complete len:119 (-) Transcript_23157:134-490(-)